MAPTLIPIADARDRVLEAARLAARRAPTQTVGVLEALDRVLSEAVIAQGDTPPFDSSAMDGYAIAAGGAERRLRIVGESRAGAPTERVLREGEAIRISTGAAVPEGAQAVIPQEQTQRPGGKDGEEVLTRAPTPVGAHIRRAGEDQRAGATILPSGTRLGPIELGAAVSAGVASVSVAHRPRVTVLTTGDELRAPGEPLRAGEIHNSNGPMLTGLADRCGAEVGPARPLPDDLAATTAGIEVALGHSDVVVICGGVSVGPHDHVKPALAALEVREVFWSVALQPGKPTWFGVAAGDRLVFGLPGNPVSAVVTFSLFVAPALATLQGAPPPLPPAARARLATAVTRARSRDQMIRVALQPGGELPAARPTGSQASHILGSLLSADALARIPAGEGELPGGAIVELSALVR